MGEGSHQRGPHQRERRDPSDPRRALVFSSQQVPSGRCCPEHHASHSGHCVATSDQGAAIFLQSSFRVQAHEGLLSRHCPWSGRPVSVCSHAHAWTTTYTRSHGGSGCTPSIFPGFPFLSVGCESWPRATFLSALGILLLSLAVPVEQQNQRGFNFLLVRGTKYLFRHLSTI